MSTPTIKVGQGNWGIKANNLLGYANTEKKFTPVEFTSTRALNTATRVNASGNIEIVNANIPRIDYFGGEASLLVEPSGTNSIRNNSMVGASAPSTLPTHYSTALAGLTRTIVGTGTENGIAYMDIRFNGTSTGGAVVISEETSTSITAASGQVWTHSIYAKLIANVSNMPSARIGMYELTSGGIYLTEGSNTITLTSSLIRFSFTRTLTNASTARVQPIFQWFVNNGTSYDFTIRVGYPQMETGSVATSVIPTTTAAVTRDADVVSVTGAVSGSIGQTSGTVYVEVDLRNLSTSVFRRILTISDGTTSNLFQIFTSDSSSIVNLGSTASGFTTLSSPTTIVGVAKIAFAYALNDVAFYINGNLIGTRTPSTIPACNSISLGSRVDSSNFLNDRIRAAALYTTRLTNEQLASLTT